MKYILLGDLHFLSKKASIDFFENQMKFFENQLFPYMLKNNITHIIQVGDTLDNRTSIDINLLSLMRTRFFNKLREYNFMMITIIGNHDMYFKNTRSTNFMSIFQELYPDNIEVIQNQTQLEINKVKVGFIPFLTPNEGIDDFIISTSEYLFGHFETQGFEIAKGITDTHSELSISTFKQYKNLKGVFSGHYHIKNVQGFVKYLGIPYNQTWSDYGNECGFYVMDEKFNITFIENTESFRFVKMLYDGNFYIDDVKVDKQELKNYCEKNQNIEVKFYIFNISTENTDYEDYLLFLRENGINYNITDNREEKNPILLTPQEVVEADLKLVNMKSTDLFLHEFIKENHEDLYDIFLGLINEE